MTKVFGINDFNFWLTGEEREPADADDLRRQLDFCKSENLKALGKIELLQQQLRDAQTEKERKERRPAPEHREQGKQ